MYVDCMVSVLFAVATEDVVVLLALKSKMLVEQSFSFTYDPDMCPIVQDLASILGPP